MTFNSPCFSLGHATPAKPSGGAPEMSQSREWAALAHPARVVLAASPKVPGRRRTRRSEGPALTTHGERPIGRARST
jgi:hypothetical protein